jgi:hypothetical protein
LFNSKKEEFMSRLSDAINRLELIAKKMEISIEDALEILEGKHPTHHVVLKELPPVKVVTPEPKPSPSPAPVEEPVVEPTPTPSETPPAPEEPVSGSDAPIPGIED